MITFQPVYGIAGDFVMRQTKLNLSDDDRLVIDAIRTKGVHHSREINRAHILSSLDRGIPESHIMDVLQIWRTTQTQRRK